MMEEKEVVPAGLVTMLLAGYLRTIYIMAAGSAVSLTTAADIYIPCCGVPATISAQIDVAGTVASATMVVTKMA